MSKENYEKQVLEPQETKSAIQNESHEKSRTDILAFHTEMQMIQYKQDNALLNHYLNR
jgi:hypothetical protein